MNSSSVNFNFIALTSIPNPKNISSLRTEDQKAAYK